MSAPIVPAAPGPRLLELQAALAAIVDPSPDPEALRFALHDLASFDRGEVRDLGPLAGWLYLVRNPRAEYLSNPPVNDDDRQITPEDAALSIAVLSAMDEVIPPQMIADQTRRFQMQQFLDALFGRKDPEEYILIWTAEGRRSSWHKGTADAAAYARSLGAKDVYVGVALSPADHGQVQRLKVEDGGERPPSSISALWCDIDVAGPGHKKQNLPPTEEDAKSILFPDMPPSVLVHSGGGWQGWWIFRKPWKLDTPEAVAAAGKLAARWNKALRARAEARGWELDSVGDLPRVLRLPGTFNQKIPGQPRPVTILHLNERRYDPRHLNSYLDRIGAERCWRSEWCSVATHRPRGRPAHAGRVHSCLPGAARNRREGVVAVQSGHRRRRAALSSSRYRRTANRRSVRCAHHIEK